MAGFCTKYVLYNSFSDLSLLSKSIWKFCFHQKWQNVEIWWSITHHSKLLSQNLNFDGEAWSNGDLLRKNGHCLFYKDLAQNGNLSKRSLFINNRYYIQKELVRANWFFKIFDFGFKSFEENGILNNFTVRQEDLTIYWNFTCPNVHHTPVFTK